MQFTMLFPASMERPTQSSTKYNITGGVDSLKTDMTAVKADLDVLKNKGVVSSCKAVQRGESQKSTTIYYNRNETNPYYTVSFPISQINLEKSFFLHEVTATPRVAFLVKVSEIKATITNNSIEVTFKGTNGDSDASAANSIVTVSCSWQIIEFY